MFKWKSHKKLEINDANKDIWKSSSSCLIPSGKNLIGNVRAVNYSISDKFEYSIRDEKNVVRTKNFWVNFKQVDFKLNTSYELVCNVPPIRETHISGLEDLRIVKCGKKYYLELLFPLLL